MDNWCSPSRQSSQSNPNWKASCANQAVGICEGNIANTANTWCPDKNLNGSDLNRMKNQCDDEVNDMVGNPNPTPDRRPPTARPTRKPTRKPTQRPTPRPTPRPANRPVDRCGLDGKCGHCKQEYVLVSCLNPLSPSNLEFM